ncbi:hypothetical protein Q3G72_023586 [Acer saccharum]|nr:hypothetical protein Q3G72_023586 [Acer saccharum]
MRSLHDRFESKVMALEENSGYKDMKSSEVIGRLLAYESRKNPTSIPPKKQKGIALKVSKVEKEENDDSNEDMALLMKRFKKFVKSEKKGFGSKGPRLEEKCSIQESGSDDFDESNETLDDEDLIANFIAFASSHKSKCTSEAKEESQEQNDSSEDDSSSNTTNGNVEKMDLQDYITKFESSRMKNKREIRRLKEENFEQSTQVDQLNEEVVRSMKNDDKLKEELALFKRNEEGLKRELEKAKGSMTRMASSTNKLDHMLAVGKSPCENRGLGFEDGKKTSTPNKTVFVKSSSNKEALPVQTPRKKIDLGQCSNNAQVKVTPRRQPQAQPTRAPQANFPQQLAH